MVRFCLVYAEHLIALTGVAPYQEMTDGFLAMQEQLDGKTNYHKARNLSFVVIRLIKEEENPVKIKFYRTMVQILVSPHVKYHGLWVTDLAVILINKMCLDDMMEVERERSKQLDLLKQI